MLRKMFWLGVWGVAVFGVCSAIGIEGFWPVLAISLLAGLAWEILFDKHQKNPFHDDDPPDV